MPNALDDVRLSTDEVELVVPTGHGPRVSRFGRVGGRNLFAEISPELQGKDTPFGDRWHIYGGHRLWYAPEEDPRSYHPDNRPVRVERRERGVTLTQEVESHTQLEKTIDVALDGSGLACITHRIRNHGAFEVALAPWALSVMAPGGVGIFPHPAYVPHPDALAPARPLVMWRFTCMADPRWTWGDRFVLLRQDGAAATAQKVGLYDEEGWMAYALGADLFVKLHEPKPGPHADFGCNVETFTNELFLELETLGPIAAIAPGAFVEHREWWMSFSGIEVGAGDDAIARAVGPCVAIAQTARAKSMLATT